MQFGSLCSSPSPSHLMLAALFSSFLPSSSLIGFLQEFLLRVLLQQTLLPSRYWSSDAISESVLGFPFDNSHIRENTLAKKRGVSARDDVIMTKEESSSYAPDLRA